VLRCCLQQVREIVGQLREGRQSLMFSATLPRSLADFVGAGLSNPQLVRLDAERKLSPDLGLAFFTGTQQQVNSVTSSRRLQKSCQMFQRLGKFSYRY